MSNERKRALEDLKEVMVKHDLWIHHDYLDRCVKLNINDVQEVVGSFEEWIDANTIQDELDKMKDDE